VPAENVAAIRRSNEAFNRRDLEGALGVFHPDVEWVDLGHAPDQAPRGHGIESARAAFVLWFEVFEEFSAELEECIEVGEAVVCVTRWHAKSRHLKLNERMAEVYEFRDGRVIRATMGYASREEALASLGVGPDRVGG
jgi:ketosteroid isomerase-like protein